MSQYHSAYRPPTFFHRRHKNAIILEMTRTYTRHYTTVTKLHTHTTTPPHPTSLTLFLLIIITFILFLNPSIGYTYAQDDPMSSVRFWSHIYDVNYVESKMYLELEISSPLTPLLPHFTFGLQPRQNEDPTSTYRTSLFDDFRFKPISLKLECYDSQRAGDNRDTRIIPSTYGQQISLLDIPIPDSAFETKEFFTTLNWVDDAMIRNDVHQINCSGYIEIEQKISPTSQESTTPHCCSAVQSFNDPEICKDSCVFPPEYVESDLNCCHTGVGVKVIYNLDPTNPQQIPPPSNSYLQLSLQTVQMTIPATLDSNDITAAVLCAEDKGNMLPCEDNSVHFTFRSIPIPASRLSVTSLGFGGIEKKGPSLWVFCSLNGVEFPLPVTYNNDSMIITSQFAYMPGWDYSLQCSGNWMQWSPGALNNPSLRMKTFFFISIYPIDDSIGAYTSIVPIIVSKHSLLPTTLTQLPPITRTFNYTGFQAISSLSFFLSDGDTLPSKNDKMVITIHAPEGSYYQLSIKYPDGSSQWNDPLPLPPPTDIIDRDSTVTLTPFDHLDKPMIWFAGNIFFIFTILPIPLNNKKDWSWDSDIDDGTSLTPMDCQVTWSYQRCLPAQDLLAHYSRLQPPPYPPLEEICLSLDQISDAEISNPLSDDMGFDFEVNVFKNTTYPGDPNPTYWYVDGEGNTSPFSVDKTRPPDEIPVFSCARYNNKEKKEAISEIGFMIMVDQVNSAAMTPISPSLINSMTPKVDTSSIFSPTSVTETINDDSINNDHDLDDYVQLPPMPFPSRVDPTHPHNHPSHPVYKRNKLYRQKQQQQQQQLQKQQQQQQELDYKESNNHDDNDNNNINFLTAINDIDEDNIPVIPIQPYNPFLDHIDPDPHDYFTFSLNNVASSFRLLEIWIDSPHLYLRGVDFTKPEDQEPCYAIRTSGTNQTAFCVPTRLDRTKFSMSYFLGFSTQPGHSYKITCPHRHLAYRNNFPFIGSDRDWPKGDQSLHKQQQSSQQQQSSHYPTTSSSSSSFTSTSSYPEPIIKYHILDKLPAYAGYIAISAVDTMGKYHTSGQIIRLKTPPPPYPPKPFPQWAVGVIIILIILAIILTIIIIIEIYCQRVNNFSCVKQSLKFCHETPCMVLFSYLWCCCPARAFHYRLRRRYQGGGMSSTFNNHIPGPSNLKGEWGRKKGQDKSGSGSGGDDYDHNLTELYRNGASFGRLDYQNDLNYHFDGHDQQNRSNSSQSFDHHDRSGGNNSRSKGRNSNNNNSNNNNNGQNKPTNTTTSSSTPNEQDDYYNSAYSNNPSSMSRNKGSQRGKGKQQQVFVMENGNNDNNDDDRDYLPPFQPELPIPTHFD